MQIKYKNVTRRLSPNLCSILLHTLHADFIVWQFFFFRFFIIIFVLFCEKTVDITEKKQHTTKEKAL